MRSDPGSRARTRTGLRRAARTAIIATGVTAAAAGVGVAGERYLIRRARSRPDSQRGEPLGERPGSERRIVSFDGTELAVNVVGPEAATTMLFVHGFSADMTVWHYQWKRFSEDHRCVLFDQRGHGRSGPAAGGDYSLQALGRDLKSVLDAEAPTGPVVLMGHSMGGMCILALADEFPEEFGTRISAVVLANTAAADLVRAVLGGLGIHAGTLLTRGARRLLANRDRAYRIRARALAGRGDLAFLLARATNFGPSAPPSMVEYVTRLAARAPVEVWTDLVGSLIDMDLGDALENITCPALVIVGDVDRLTPPSSALALKRRLPDARMVVLKGSGHCSLLERHAQFNEAIERFIHQALERRPHRAPA
ncbi:MAG: alpha/beta fold hydrolase [Actinomycetota bacterium]